MMSDGNRKGFYKIFKQIREQRDEIYELLAISIDRYPKIDFYRKNVPKKSSKKDASPSRKDPCEKTEKQEKGKGKNKAAEKVEIREEMSGDEEERLS